MGTQSKVLEARVKELEGIVADAYIAVGILADRAGVMETEPVLKLMDNLCYAKAAHKDVIPFELPAAVCQGENCGRTDGTHSPECFAEAEKSFNTRLVDFAGFDPLDPTKGAHKPMIPESWRFGFSARPDGTLRFGPLDDGPFVAREAVELPTQEQIDNGPHAGTGNIPSDYAKGKEVSHKTVGTAAKKTVRKID